MIAKIDILRNVSSVSEGGAPVYLYRTKWLSPANDGVIMSPHWNDAPFVFDTASTNAALNGCCADAQAIARMMSASWAAFSRTGDPQMTELSELPAYMLEPPVTIRKQ